MFKKILLGLSNAAMASTLFALFLCVLLASAIRANNFKHWGQQSGIYSTVTDNLLAEAQKKQPDNLTEGLSPKDPLVQSAVKDALNTQFIQSSGETIIDSTFNWLEGKSTQPDFSINLVPAKEKFADSVAANAKARYLSLPACKAGTLPSSADPLKIECRPSVLFDIDAEVANFKTRILASKDFLPSDTITSKSTQLNSAERPNEINEQLPKTYKAIQTAPIILAAIAGLLAVAVLLLNASKIAGLRNLGILLLTGAVTAGLSLWLIQFIIDKLCIQFLKNAEGTDAFKQSLVQIGKLIRDDVTRLGVRCVVAYALLGIAALVFVYLHKRRSVGTASEKSEQTPPPEPKAE